MSWPDVIETAKEVIHISLAEFFSLRMTSIYGDNVIDKIYRYCEKKVSKSSNSVDIGEINKIKEKIEEKGLKATKIYNFDSTALNHLLRFSDFQNDLYEPFPPIEKENVKKKIKNIANCRNYFSHYTD